MKKLFAVSFIVCALIFMGHAQALRGGGEANPELLTNKASLTYWQQLKFGLFVHWGPVSLRGTEIGWSRGKQVPFEEYDQLYKEFNPVLFDADEWVSMLKSAGMKYIIIVSKHHDGFVMWDSETTDYDIMSTSIKRDLMQEISSACIKHGILFGTYYSICDWRHPDYPVEQNNPERKEGANMESYTSYMKAQLKELVDKYQTRILWFDGEWEDPWTHEMGMDLYKYVRDIDDEILINNRVDKGRHGMEGISKSDRFAGDFATPEQQVGRYDPLTPWESCITICTQWAWKPNDELKSKKECLHTLIRTVGGNGNLLFNVGPMLDGRIEQRQIDRLKEMGQWLTEYGETIYESRGGPVPPQEWGVSTQKDDKIYLHILEKRQSINIEDFPVKVSAIKVFTSGKDIAYTYHKNKLSIDLPDYDENVIDFVLEIN